MRVSYCFWILMAGLMISGGCATTSANKDILPTSEWRGHTSPYDFHRAISYTLLHNGQTRQALLHIHTLIRLKPKSADAHYLLALANLDMRIFPEVRSELEKALALDKKFAPALGLFGVYFDRLGKHQKAETYHRKAVAADPKSASNFNNLGFSLYLQGRYQEAIEAYQKALGLDPSMSRIHNNLAFAYAKKGEKHLAFKHFKLAGSEAEANNNLGYLFEQEGKLEYAYEMYLKALKSDPKLEHAKENLARLGKRMGKRTPEVAFTQPSPSKAEE